MWPNRFPLFFWTADLRAVREHLSVELGGPGRCFDVAFGAVANGPPAVGYHHIKEAHGKVRGGKPGYSQFNIVANFAFWHRPGRYVWDMGTVDRAFFRQRLAVGLRQGAARELLPGAAGDEAAYLATVSDAPTIALGRNGVSAPHSLVHSCCVLHPDLAPCGASNPAAAFWDRTQVLGYCALERGVNPAWLAEPSAALRAHFAAAKARLAPKEQGAPEGNGTAWGNGTAAAAEATAAAEAAAVAAQRSACEAVRRGPPDMRKTCTLGSSLVPRVHKSG